MHLPPHAPEVFETSLPWVPGYSALGADFVSPLAPTPLPAPYWVGKNLPLGQALGLPDTWTSDNEWLHAFTGNRNLDNTSAYSAVYSGHQFGQWAGQLGDGRAITLGEAAGYEFQLKGAGPTPYSRMGDGRAVLRSSIREFLCSEAMHALGIPTTRALCVTGSDAPVRREAIETAAVVTRLSPSMVRFGHFEHFCHHGLHDQLRTLADYVIDRFYPQCRHADAFSANLGGNPYAALLQCVTLRTAELLAQWQAVGFCHGVMNTDNMSILGLTLDYGPFQFLDAYDPAHICNHSDHQGRYAFGKQPNVAYWNLFCLGQALMPLIEDQAWAMSALETYKEAYPKAFAQRMAAKLGFERPTAATGTLTQDLLTAMAAQRVDYTIFWSRLTQWSTAHDPKDHRVRDLFLDSASIDAWLLQFSELHAQHPYAHSTELMQKNNPQFVLRNHLGELAIQAARVKDFSVLEDLLNVLQAPFEAHAHHQDWADFPPDWASAIAISCSS
ncbi:protein adenylyltransferase SelO [Rhodoferax aquaticus]|uniref:Protein nucleotidyltransferase YdiU n=1 Tax=Rhodoferax aquaticus TaxID=2527691 RepID=A0A515EPR5_9BURK|nr:YdiU family protein [Rhodoferax aquaticus]QDL54664.1 YdiU family protein [Rhodoferax aquaticus]